VKSQPSSLSTLTSTLMFMDPSGISMSNIHAQILGPLTQYTGLLNTAYSSLVFTSKADAYTQKHTYLTITLTITHPSDTVTVSLSLPDICAWTQGSLMGC